MVESCPRATTQQTSVAVAVAEMIPSQPGQEAQLTEYRGGVCERRRARLPVTPPRCCPDQQINRSTASIEEADRSNIDKPQGACSCFVSSLGTGKPSPCKQHEAIYSPPHRERVRDSPQHSTNTHNCQQRSSPKRSKHTGTHTTAASRQAHYRSA